MFIVLGCNALFIVSLMQHISAEEISEELLLVAWSVAQSLRMIVIARKQQMAIRSAKTLIDFTNIGLETEVLDMQGRSVGAGEHVEIELEEVIVFDDEARERAGSITGSSKSNSRRSVTGTSGKVTMTQESAGSSAGVGSIQSNSKLRNMKERQKALKK